MNKHYIAAAVWPVSGKCYIRKRWYRDFGWTTEREMAHPFESQQDALEAMRRDDNEDPRVEYSLIEVTEVEFKLTEGV